MKTETLFSSSSDLWETPKPFFDALDYEFHFGIDVCALPANTKCRRYFTPEVDGLKQSWNGYGAVWCNPPYGRQIGKWLQKAQETADNGDTVVFLAHARTDTKWFHDYVYQKPGVEIRFVKGRLKFGGSPNNAPFPSMIIIFRGSRKETEIEHVEYTPEAMGYEK